MSISLNVDKSNCCGCNACVNICPKNAVSMQTDEYGFAYPHINKNICVECGLCDVACEKVHKNEGVMPIKAFAAVHQSKHILLKSSSGGVFSALAEHFLNIGGAVCGCVFDDNLNAVHICTEKESDIFKIRKSKYIQSNVGFIYRDVKKRLIEGQQVLFTGTPCQIAALYAVVGKDYDNLTTMDLVCHGVPSQLLFNQFISYLEKCYRTKIVNFDFRSKKYGWPRYTMEFTDSKHRKVNIGKYREFYISSFTGGDITRQSCLSCNFACPNRISDITMGDFWGYEKVNLKFNTFRGTSIFTINTPKATKLIDILLNKLNCEEIDYNVAIKGNTCLQHATPTGKNRNLYMQAIKEDKIEDIAFKYKQINKNMIFRERGKLMLPAFVFDIIKKRKAK